jgi:hypothetical protein
MLHMKMRIKLNNKTLILGEALKTAPKADYETANH